ncbi:MAG: hypothetical protein VB137_05545 [Burkholderia sp.]
MRKRAQTLRAPSPTNGACESDQREQLRAARERHPARWSSQTRNWTPTGSVALNSERDAIVNEVAISRVHKQAYFV